MQQPTLATLASRAPDGRRRGITSICSAHPFVIEATPAAGGGRRRHGADRGDLQPGQPARRLYRHDAGGLPRLRLAMAEAAGLPKERILLGGDHLGPNPWKSRPADAAMQESERMVAAYVEAGFTKIHLDTSMACSGDPVPLPEATIAARAARLAAVAERAAASARRRSSLRHRHRGADPGRRARDASRRWRSPGRRPRSRRPNRIATPLPRPASARPWPRDRSGRAAGRGVRQRQRRPLCAAKRRPTSAPHWARFPASSSRPTPPTTRRAECLAALVEDGFAILKVGPWLTFAMREALYGLDAIAPLSAPADALARSAQWNRSCSAEPADWQPYYGGSADGAACLQRHFSYSDRIRYYWPHPQARAAVDLLLLGLRM